MIIFPAIDVIGGKAVRLLRGEYDKKTEYGDPCYFAEEFKRQGATHIHTVDLDGAKAGKAVNFEVITAIKKKTDLFVEIGGGVRDLETIKKYIDGGIDRVILGTSAAGDGEFLKSAVENFGDKIAVGADVKDGFIAVKGWTEKSGEDLFSFLKRISAAGVKTVICTDVSKDGALCGTNVRLYEEISSRFSMDVTASGGVTDIDDIKKLKSLGLYGAIIGKAYYSGRISLADAIKVAK